MSNFTHDLGRILAAPAPSPAPLYKALAAAGLIAPFLSHGAIITVTTTAAVGDVANCSLRDAARAIRSPGFAFNACAVADVAPVGNEIRFAANVVGTITYSDTDALFNYGGVEFLPRSNLSIVGPGASTLGITCDANAVSMGSMVVFTNVASNVSISGLAFNNCLATGVISAGAAGLTVFDFSPNVVNQISLSDLVVSGNSGYVGGIAVSSTGVTTLRRVAVTGNNGALVGGVVVQGLSASADIDLQSSTISNNTGGTAGGSALFTDGDVSVNNTTVSGNSGGQFAFGLQGDEMGVRHSTIVRNVPGVNVLSYVGFSMGLNASAGRIAPKSGGGISKALTVTAGLNNSIVCGNQVADYSADTNVVANYNLIGVRSPISPGAFFGTGNVTDCTAAQLNNWLGPLANNGGPTPTHALLNVVGNPAINGGDPAYVGSPTDQTGITNRVSDGRTDMGAFEFAAAPAPQATGLPVPVNGLASLGALSLALAALGARRRKKGDAAKS